MRDKLIHTCFGIDVALVWATVVNRVPELRKDMHRILALERSS